ncbi:methyltransferase type 12 [Knoellia subterranea KCTC 19937]|uniref:Methyltransferase type 12 n=1 Tax=Knoellia subterranea KCTC 19937 TaxID=1385521 RepID=A0A0A0JK55_9MICO|nr:methyltransferase type 12 [Knoellia subterranea KCTC 19937]
MVPDDKDWTWTLERPCPDCGFDPTTVDGPDIASLVTAYTTPWTDVLARPDVAARPNPSTWSPLEYACHVRDVCDLFADRVQLMLDEDGARFANWDQDVTAVESAYAAQPPVVVASEIPVAAARLSAAYAGVSGSQWERRGVRSNGSEFTVLTLGRYGLHDLRHHVWDVGASVD